MADSNWQFADQFNADGTLRPLKKMVPGSNAKHMTSDEWIELVDGKAKFNGS